MFQTTDCGPGDHGPQAVLALIREAQKSLMASRRAPPAIKTVLFEDEMGRQGLAVAMDNEPVADALARDLAREYGTNVDYIRFVSCDGRRRYQALLSTGHKIMVTLLSNQSRRRQQAPQE